ncbi:hypothetical protein [Gordonia alkanivorans]|uniref:hypothetical protein n=1 Tax=Gordonia alkanivorans TaxID=84096 RepID=UPI0004B43EFD|nr:hypothetical protein [Gordonia alkanivorans]
MPHIVSVVRFDDRERDILGGGAQDRSKAGQKLGNELKSWTSRIFRSANGLADTNPSSSQLSAILTDMSILDAVLEAMPPSNTVSELQAQSAEVRKVVQAALDALPAS